MASKQTPVHQSEPEKEIQEPVQDPVYFEDAGDKVDVRSILKIARGEEPDAAEESGDSPEEEDTVTIKAVQSSPEPRKRPEQSVRPVQSVSGTGAAQHMEISRDAYMNSLPWQERVRRRVSEALHTREEAAEARRMRSHMVRAAKYYGVELSEEDLKAPEPARPDKRESHEVIERQVSREREEKVRSRLEERQAYGPEKTAVQTVSAKADAAKKAAAEKAEAAKAPKAENLPAEKAVSPAKAAAEESVKSEAAEAAAAVVSAKAEAEHAAAAKTAAEESVKAEAVEAAAAVEPAKAEAEEAAAAVEAAKAKAEEAAKAKAAAEAAALREAAAEKEARKAAEEAAAVKAAKEADERAVAILRREELEEFRRQQEYNARVLQRYREDAPDQVDRMLGRYGLSKEATVRLATLFLIAVLSVIYVMGRNKQPDLVDVPVAGEGMTGSPAATDAGSGTGGEEESGDSENSVESESENPEP